MRWKGPTPELQRPGPRRAGPARPGGKVALGGGGLVSLLLIMGVVWIAGGNPLTVLQSSGSGGGISLPGAPQTGAQSNAPIDPREEELADFNQDRSGRH